MKSGPRLRRGWRLLCEAGAQLVGMPSYDDYLEHLRRHHPERQPMTREAFFRERLDARYGGKGRISRCC